MKPRPALLPFVALVVVVLASAPGSNARATPWHRVAAGFAVPPDEARPWVYWFWMDGNVSREGITADLEAMRQAGLGGVILMEVDVGIPRGPVKFMSPEWRRMFAHAVHEAQRLGLQVTLNAGPGWTGSGGPWVRPEQSMQHLVASATDVTGPGRFDAVLAQPQRRPAFFGDGALPPELEEAKNSFYRDECVLAFPRPKEAARLADIDEKALYVRAPYSSQPGTKPFLPSPAEYPPIPPGASIDGARVVDLTSRIRVDGRLEWEVPAGNWTILRFGRTSTGANTRPAPAPGLGLESDKLDPAALDAHFEAFVGALLREVGRPQTRGRPSAGWTMLHIDSWEMGSQNWTAGFRDLFRRRRGYDLFPYLPTLTGRVVESPEISERFLFDLRLTLQELVVENHARRLKTLGRRHGFGLSIEPYDMNPCADLTLGRVADVPMSEFWLMGFDTAHTVREAASVGHTNGRRVVAAEAFTSTDAERWQAHPAMMKTLGDWAFCAGVNRIVFHRYQHQPALDRWPGMTMGPYGVHWERTQTWWDLVPAYHQYLARCQYVLRQGLPVADVCFLVAEGAPQVFRPPTSALRGTPPDPVSHAFDACAPETLLERMSVRGGRWVLPDGMSYRVLVLPERETMSPALLRRLASLVRAGGIVVGPPPRKAPGLAGYPGNDEEVRRWATELWGDLDGVRRTERSVGRGRVVWCRTAPEDLVRPGGEPEQYGNFTVVRRELERLGVTPDFSGDERLRYHHRRDGDVDAYFVASRATSRLNARCGFRVTGKAPELWDPETGSLQAVAVFEERDGRTWIPLPLEPEGSVFVVFRRPSAGVEAVVSVTRNGVDAVDDVGLDTYRVAPGSLGLRTESGGSFVLRTAAGRAVAIEAPAPPAPQTVAGPWSVRFQSGRGAPSERTWETLRNWIQDPDPGVRYFSGKAIYRIEVVLGPVSDQTRTWLDLGRVEVLARVRWDGRELGVVWKPPFRVELGDAAKAGTHVLEIEVANRWPNRLIGDKRVPPAERVTSTTWNPFAPDAPLLSSGLLGPVQLRFVTEATVVPR